MNTDLAEIEIKEQYERDAQILRLIREIQTVFETYFDRTWFSVIIDDMPIDFRTIREIREMVSLKTIYPGDEKDLYEGVAELESFINHANRFLLPVIKERLGVSRLHPARMVRDRNQYILRRFVAYTFPFNLERLHALTLELKACLLFHYPFLG